MRSDDYSLMIHLGNTAKNKIWITFFLFSTTRVKIFRWHVSELSPDSRTISIKHTKKEKNSANNLHFYLVEHHSGQSIIDLYDWTCESPTINRFFYHFSPQNFEICLHYCLHAVANLQRMIIIDFQSLLADKKINFDRSLEHCTNLISQTYQEIRKFLRWTRL